MRNLLFTIAVALGLSALGSTAFAQTNTATQTPTPTNTPTATFTVVPTNTASASTPTAAPLPTQYGSHAVVCEPTRFCAWRFGYASVQFGACSSSRATATLTVPGIQVGDFFSVEAPNDASGIIPDAVLVSANNTVVIYAVCSGNGSKVLLPYHWWDRTYKDTNKNLGDPQNIP